MSVRGGVWACFQIEPNNSWAMFKLYWIDIACAGRKNLLEQLNRLVRFSLTSINVSNENLYVLTSSDKFFLIFGGGGGVADC